MEDYIHDVANVKNLTQEEIEAQLTYYTGNRYQTEKNKEYKPMFIALLKAYKNLNKKFGHFDETVLHLAATEEYKSDGLLREVLENFKGCDVNVKDQNGETPLHYVVYRKELKKASLLLERGADVNCTYKNDNNKIISVLSILCQNRVVGEEHYMFLQLFHRYGIIPQNDWFCLEEEKTVYKEFIRFLTSLNIQLYLMSDVGRELSRYGDVNRIILKFLN